MNEQCAQIPVSSFVDTQLRIATAGLASSRPETKEAARAEALSEPVLVFEGEHERQGCQGTNAMDLLESKSLWILRLSEKRDLLFEGLNLCRQLINEREQRANGRLQAFWNLSKGFLRITGTEIGG